MGEPRMLYGNQLPSAQRQAALAAYVHRYTVEHIPTWSRQAAPNGRHYAPQYRTDLEWLGKTRFPIVEDRTGIRLKSGQSRNSDCESSDPSWPYGQWLDLPFNPSMSPRGKNGNDSNNDHGPDGMVPPNSPQSPGPAHESTHVGAGTTQQLNQQQRENIMDKLELIEHAQRFASEGTKARVYNVKTDGDKLTHYKGAIVSIHEGQALQMLNDKGSFVVHHAEGLTVGDVVQVTYAGGTRSVTPFVPGTASDVSVENATARKTKAPKAVKTTITKAAKSQKATASKEPSIDSDPVTDATAISTIDAADEDVSPAVDETVAPVQPAKTMEGITNDLYRQAAERIVAAIDAGTSIWQKPWQGAANASRPHNAQSGLNYSGINRVLLTFELVNKQSADARFLTYKQIQAMSREMAKTGTAEKDLPHVMKGSKGLPIYKMGFIEKKMPVLDSTGKPMMDADGKPMVKITRGRSYLQSYIVFHSSNIANMPALPDVEEKAQWERHAAIEDLIDKMGVPVKYEAQNRAYFSPSSNSIMMPERSQFTDTLDESGSVIEPGRDKFYSVVLHEESHAVGHSSKLNRDLTGRPGSASYAKEELIAETSSFFLTQSLLGIGANSETIKRTAAYLDSWKSLILDDPKALFSAFAAAEKAADWVMQRHPIQLEAAAKQAIDSPSAAHVVDSVIPAVIPSIRTVESTRTSTVNPWAAPTVPVDPKHSSSQSSFGMTH